MKIINGNVIIIDVIDFLSSRAKTLLIFVLFTFATMSIFGLWHMSGMEANKYGNMDGCIFTGETMLCQMSVIEHVSLWQGMFTAVPQNSLMLLVLLVLLVAALFTAKNSIGPPSLFKSDALAHNLYLAQHPDLPIFNHLKEAFSQGILNPKIYEFAIL